MAKPAASNQLTGLQLRTFKDFTAGLWQRGTTKEVPPNGLTVLTDALPLKSGGLRAAMRWTMQVDTTSAGLDWALPKPVRLAGFHFLNQQTNANQSRFFLMLAPFNNVPAGGVLEVWATEGTAPNVTAAFTRTKSHSMNAGSGYVATRFITWAGTVKGTTQEAAVYWHVGDGMSSELGVWSGNFNSPGLMASSSTFNTACFMIEGHQQSIAAVSVFAKRRMRIDYSDVGSDLNIASTGNPFFLITPERFSDVAYIHSSYAGDLYVLRRAKGWVNVQGPLNSPTVYEVSRVHAPQLFSFACTTPRGMVYLTADEGVFAFNGTSEPEYLSPQFVGSPMTEPVLVNTAMVPPAIGQAGFLGQPVFAGHYLFTPKGYILDFDTGAWFISSQLNLSPPFSHFVYDDVFGACYAARSDANGYVQMFSTLINESTMARASSYTFEVPSVSTPAHLTELRLIEFDIQNYAASTISVLLTYNDPSGNVVQSTLGPFAVAGTGDQQVRIDVGVGTGAPTADYFKIRPTISTAAPTEAPTLGEMRVWTKPGPPLPFRR